MHFTNIQGIDLLRLQKIKSLFASKSNNSVWILLVYHCLLGIYISKRFYCIMPKLFSSIAELNLIVVLAQRLPPFGVWNSNAVIIAWIASVWGFGWKLLWQSQWVYFTYITTELFSLAIVSSMSSRTFQSSWSCSNRSNSTSMAWETKFSLKTT